MHVVHLVVSDRLAGVEHYIARLARAQAAAGEHVTILGGQVVDMRTAAGPQVQVHPVATLTAGIRALRALHTRPDIINTHMTSADLAAARSLTGARLVSTRHFPAVRGSGTTRRALLRPLSRLLAAQISVSRFVADAIDEPSVVVPSGVPTRATVDRRGLRRIAVLGRLEHEKNTRLALDAFAASGLAARGWSLEVIGSGSRWGSLHRRTEILGITDAVRFHGHLTDPSAVLDSTSALLAPCSVEALGLAALEAMAAGLPVVAARAGGHLETVGAACPDLLFEPDDVTAASALLRRIAESPTWATASGRQLRDLQRRDFTLERQVAATAGAYEQALR
ncbi:glycosyltransferase family 4 protein [Demetria terragena]|uniref:glycosyltransferase family 4 protein n=1 Tax=Demetria terragena TaxID=63959 RepID=UPI0003613F37|nr:glycosyltransferase family 4 protein [Demetria terragena]